jgi:hypothetical protein
VSAVYDALLVVHSFTRWCVLLAAAFTLAHALRPLWASAARPLDPRVGRVFVACVDVQVSLGLSLYFVVSPFARAARMLWAEQGLAALWADRQLRFFGLIHPCLALLAACLAHAAWVGVRRAETDASSRRWLGAGAALALVIFLAAVPWPFLGHERPWVRF